MGVNEIARIIKQFLMVAAFLLLGGKTSHKIRHEGAHFRRNLISSLLESPRIRFPLARASHPVLM